MKQVWVLVGGNGAGKSTFYDKLLSDQGLPFIKVDKIAKEYFPDDPEGNSYKAAKLAETIREEQMRNGNSFCFETVFSHPSKIDFLGKAISLSYEIILIFIHVSSTQLNKARVAQRVVEGGHSVPDDKIESRIPRTLNNVKNAIPLCNEVHAFDNSRLDTPFLPVLSIVDGITEEHIDPLPIWASELISNI